MVPVEEILHIGITPTDLALWIKGRVDNRGLEMIEVAQGGDHHRLCGEGRFALFTVTTSSKQPAILTTFDITNIFLVDLAHHRGEAPGVLLPLEGLINQ